MSMPDQLPMVFPDDSPRARRGDLPSYRLSCNRSYRSSYNHAEAADTNDTAGSQRAVLRVLSGAQKPLADFEIEKAHRLFVYEPYTEQRLRTARHELTVLGRVVADGATRTPRGRRAATWRLA